MIQSPKMKVSLVCLRENQKLCAWNLIDPSLKIRSEEFDI